MSIVNVSFSIKEAQSLLSYVNELEEHAGLGGSYPPIYSALKERIKQAKENEDKLTK